MICRVYGSKEDQTREEGGIAEKFQAEDSEEEGFITEEKNNYDNQSHLQ